MARYSGGTLVAIGGTLAIMTGAARGGAAVAPVHVVAAVPAEAGGARDATFVGAAGQLYRPGRDGVWRREALGGVAVSVRGALRGQAGAIYITGSHAPSYRFSQGAWHLRPMPNRGRIVAASASGVPAMAVERHVYLQRGTGWTRLATHSKAVTSLWAGDRTRVYVGDADGGLARYGKGGFAPIQANLAAGDSITGFAGRSGKDLYAMTAHGAMLAVGPTRATRVVGDGKLEGARALLLGGSPAGVHAVVEVESSIMLAAVSGNALTWVDDLPALPAGDRVAALVTDSDGWLVVATSRGHVVMRSPDGAWAAGRVSDELPASAIRSFDHAHPARSP